MQLFLGIGSVWIAGMIAFILLDSNGNNTKKRCNVRREVMEFKALSNKMSAETRNRK